MGDISERADDYERRLSSAGGNETVLGGLVIGVQRTKRIQLWLGISIVFDVLLSIAFGVVAIYAQNNANSAAETAKLAVVAAKVSCDASSKNSTSINAVLNELIESVRTNPDYTPAEKKQRIDGYEALIVKVPDCDNPAVDVKT